MKWFLYAIALIWIGIGAWMILYSHESRKVFKQLVKNLDRRILFALLIFGSMGPSVLADKVFWDFGSIERGVYILEPE